MVDDGEKELLEALTRYIPYEGISKLNTAAYVARAYDFRRRAEALFHAECTRQMKHGVVTSEQADRIAIVRRKRLQFGRSNQTRGKYTYDYVPGTRTPDVRTGAITVSAALVDWGCPVQELLLLIRHEISHAANPDHGHDAVWREYDLAVGGDGETCDTSSATKGILGHKVEIFCPVGGYETKGRTGHFFQTAQIKPTPRKLRRACRKCHRDTNGKPRLHAWRRVSILETSDAFNGKQQSFVAHPTIQLLDAHPERGFLTTFKDRDYLPPASGGGVVQSPTSCDLCGETPSVASAVCQVCRMVY